MAEELGVARGKAPPLGLSLADREPATCGNPDCDLYPYYGVAPHICYDLIGKQIGQSIGLPPSVWPANFVIDLEPGATAETVSYPNACGVYYCPTCRAGMPLAPPEGISATPATNGDDHG